VGRQEYPRDRPAGARGSTRAHSARYVPPNLYAPSHLDADTDDNAHPGTTHRHAGAPQPDSTARSHTGRRSANQCPIPNTQLFAPNANALVAHLHPTTADLHPAADCHASSPMDRL
jgi:hypothetical protein